MGEFEVAIVGAGMAGLYLGDQLRRRGIAFSVYEKAEAVAGTWRDNHYPGLQCDVMVRSYEFSHDRDYRWSHRYAPGAEIRRYLQDFSDRNGVTSHIRFGTELMEARYDKGGWQLRSKDGQRFAADVVVAATGFLHQPTIPSVPGLETFAGPSFHSARWDDSLDLDGKRIGVVGMGSSGIQIVSALGNAGHEVAHFIRTPQWVQKRTNARITPLERWVFKHPSLARRWDAYLLRKRIRTEGSEMWRLEPGPERDRMRKRFLDDLEEQIPDPVLRAKLTPDFELGCKRIPKSADIYQVLQRPNVTPVFGPIRRIEPKGVVDADRNLHPLDVLVFATGFDAHAYMRPMQIFGADGVTVDELWRDGVYSYRGVGVPKQPNFFLLNGPFAPVNSLAIPTLLKDEVGFLIKVIESSAETRSALAPTTEATERFRAEVRSALPNTTFVSCRNWFMDSHGTPIVWPWTKAKHSEQFVGLDLSDFEVFGRNGQTPSAGSERSAFVGDIAS
jgi:cation diffusion facilitator CzcD-associated flavoprotein CzcO